MKTFNGRNTSDRRIFVLPFIARTGNLAAEYLIENYGAQAEKGKQQGPLYQLAPEQDSPLSCAP